MLARLSRGLMVVKFLMSSFTLNQLNETNDMKMKIFLYISK